MRRALSIAALVLGLGTASASVEAKPINQAESKVKSELRVLAEYVDLEEFATAQKMVEGHLKDLTNAGSATRPIAAETHARLGVLHLLASKNTKAAKAEFELAISIDKNVVLPKFAGKRAKIVFGRVYEEMFPTIDCEKLRGVYHRAVALGQEGAPLKVEASLGKYLQGNSAFVMFRGARGGSFHEVAMEKVDGCLYRGEIPAVGVNAPKIEYYLETRLADGRASARRGKPKLPYVTNVSFGPVAEPEAPKPQASVAVSENDSKTAESNSSDGEDEVEDLLLVKPKSPKGSGCAGCQSGTGSSANWLWGLALMLGLFRRKKQA